MKLTQSTQSTQSTPRTDSFHNTHTPHILGSIRIHPHSLPIPRRAPPQVWNVAKVVKSIGFDGILNLVDSFTSCNKRLVMDSWKANANFQTALSTFSPVWGGDSTCPALTDVQFKAATFEWIADSVKATAYYGDIEDWDTSEVKDFTRVFSKDRDKAGLVAVGGNAKAATFNGDITKCKVPHFLQLHPSTTPTAVTYTRHLKTRCFVQLARRS